MGALAVIDYAGAGDVEGALAFGLPARTDLAGLYDAYCVLDRRMVKEQGRPMDSVRIDLPIAKRIRPVGYVGVCGGRAQAHESSC